MNSIVYERKQFTFDSRKMLVYLVNKSNPNLNLGSTIKQLKFNHNNTSINKLVSISLSLTQI